MTGLPVATPVTTPVAALTVARPVALLDQEPPPEASARVTVVAGQIAAAPVMAAGNGLVVSVAVVIQPVGNV